ncbi:hypothetical protein Tco_0315869 [Tanacetum coccineum]
MHYDSQSTLSRAYNQVYNGKSRHIGLRHRQVNQLINDGVITVSFLRSSKNLANPFTKGLPRKLIESTSQGMGLKPISEAASYELKGLALKHSEKPRYRPKARLNGSAQSGLNEREERVTSSSKSSRSGDHRRSRRDLPKYDRREGECRCRTHGSRGAYYPVDNRVVASRVTVYREVARWRARIVLFARPRILCSSWPRAGYASLWICGARVSCGRVWIMFLAGRLAFGYFGSFQVLGLGQLFIVWSGLVAQVKLHVIMSPQYSVSFVRAKDIAKLKSAQLLAVNGLVCVPHTLLSARIVTTVHLSLFSPFDESFLLRFPLSFYSHSSSSSSVYLFLTARALLVTADLRPELPDQNAIIKDSPEGKIAMYTRFIEFANFRIPFRSFTESDVRPTLLRSDDEEMGLLNFVNSANPFKVKTGERTLAENEVPLLTKTEDRVISPSPQTISLVDHTIQDELNVNSGQVDAGSGSAVPAVEDITSYFVTPTPEHALEDDLCDNVRTHPPSGRFVVLSSSSADTDIPASSQVVTPVSSAPADVSVPVIDLASDVRGSSAAGLEARALSATPSQGSSADDFYES